MTYAWQQPKWPNFTVDLDVVSELLEQYWHLCTDATKEVGLLEKQDKQDALLEWLVSEAIATSSIEGENLNRDDVRSSILNHLGGHRPPLRVSDPRAEGVAALVLDVRWHASKPLSARLLCKWQSMVVQPRPYLPEPLTIGDFRTSSQPMQIVSGEIGREKVHYEAPPSDQVRSEMEQFIEWYNETMPSLNRRNQWPGLVRAAVAHAWLELIHPFSDGNGRVGRAVAEHAIFQDMRSTPLFSLSAAIEANKNDYYDELGKVNHSLDLTSWVAWFAKTACAAQRNAIQQVDFSLQKARFWDAHGKEAFNERQTKAINRMFAAGASGFKGGMTKKKYIRLTGAAPATATRDLGSLAEKGAFISSGGGRSISYELNLPQQVPDFVERLLAPKLSTTLTGKKKDPGPSME